MIITTSHNTSAGAALLIVIAWIMIIIGAILMGDAVWGWLAPVWSFIGGVMDWIFGAGTPGLPDPELPELEPAQQPLYPAQGTPYDPGSKS